MKFKEIKNLNLKDLVKKSNELSHQILDAKMKLSMKRLPDPLTIRRLRKDRARVQMAIHQNLNKIKKEKTTDKNMNHK